MTSTSTQRKTEARFHSDNSSARSFHTDNVIQFKRGDPRCPVPARIAELQQAVLDGTIKAEYVKIAIYILQSLKPDRVGNWRTIKPVTHALIAEKFGCCERTVRTALADLRRHFQWFNWRKVEDETVFRMGPDGCMIGKMVARCGSGASEPKEHPRRWSSKEERNRSSYKGKGNPAEAAAEPASIRLARWRAALPEAVVDRGVALGMKLRFVLAVADRFAKWYGTTHPERAPADLTAKFLEWLRRDAERMVAAKAKREARATVIEHEFEITDHADDSDGEWFTDDPPPQWWTDDPLCGVERFTEARP